MEDLDIKDGEQVEVTLKDKEAVIRPKRTDTGTQTISLRFFLIPTVLAGLFFLAYFIYFQILQVLADFSDVVAGVCDYSSVCGVGVLLGDWLHV